VEFATFAAFNAKVRQGGRGLAAMESSLAGFSARTSQRQTRAAKPRQTVIRRGKHRPPAAAFPRFTVALSV
jgi:hypothetical protein